MSPGAAAAADAPDCVPMPTVLLVRHAQASYGTADYDVLSTVGHRQAEVLARDLARRGIAAGRIISGGLRRQRDTAAALAGTATVEVDAGWDEYDSADVLTHHSSAGARLEAGPGGGPPLSSRDFQVIMDGALREWVAAGSGSTAAEPFPAFAARIDAALERLTSGLEPGMTALACTSGGVIAALCVALLRVPQSALVPLNRVSVNTAVTRLAHSVRGTSLLSFNEYAHLDADAIGLRTSR